MLSQPLDPLLERPRKVLVVGIGGGFDLICGLPLVLRLRHLGHQVALANLTFSPLDDVRGGRRVLENLIRLDADSESPAEYFPEGYLSRWFRSSRGEEQPVWAIEQSGVPGVTAAYRWLAEEHETDLLLQVDGGVDALLRGDEYSLGTPTWDAISLAAASQTHVEDRILAFVGFGAERYDKISHAEALHRFAELAGRGGLLGVTALLRQSPEGEEFLDALRFVHRLQGPAKTSIVASTIQAAMEGLFGERPVNARTRQTPIWVSPLSQLVWFTDLKAVASAKGYMEALLQTRDVTEAATLIEHHHNDNGRSSPLKIPI